MALLGCKPVSAGSPEATAPAAATSEHHWGYLGPGAPEHWGELSAEFATCQTGQFQSPIDLTPIAKADVDALTISYKPDELRILNNGHTVQINHKADSTLSLVGHEFRLLQYHVHSPSEHTESGTHHALEMHLVHQDDAGNYAVIAVFFDEGPDDGPDAVWQHLPERADGIEHDYVGEQVDPSELLPESLVHYQYHGSLTTPPCTETVTWNVLQTPVTVSAERIAHFRELYAANARPVQPRPDWCLAPHKIGS
ncbi:MAG: carbonic anhydrase family protein [Myxococcota bacterium]